MSRPPRRHAARSKLERAVCREMDRQGIPHEHRSLHFRVRMPSGGTVEYEPDIVARRGSILFLLEHVEERERPERMALLSLFLDQHSPDLVLILLAPSARLPDLPPSAYDEVYDASDATAVVRRIREQDPAGILRPFRKPPAR